MPFIKKKIVSADISFRIHANNRYIEYSQESFNTRKIKNENACLTHNTVYEYMKSINSYRHDHKIDMLKTNN